MRTELEQAIAYVLKLSNFMIRDTGAQAAFRKCARGAEKWAAIEWFRTLPFQRKVSIAGNRADLGALFFLADYIGPIVAAYRAEQGETDGEKGD